MTAEARHLIVHGRVQGVGFRDWTVKTARALGLCGWVRNLPEGTVEAHLEGAPAAIERMIAAMHEGPPHAAPTRVAQAQAQAQDCKSFTRR